MVSNFRPQCEHTNTRCVPPPCQRGIVRRTLTGFPHFKFSQGYTHITSCATAARARTRGTGRYHCHPPRDASNTSSRFSLRAVPAVAAEFHVSVQPRSTSFAVSSSVHSVQTLLDLFDQATVAPADDVRRVHRHDLPPGSGDHFGSLVARHAATLSLRVTHPHDGVDVRCDLLSLSAVDEPKLTEADTSVVPDAPLFKRPEPSRGSW